MHDGSKRLKKKKTYKPEKEHLLDLLKERNRHASRFFSSLLFSVRNHFYLNFLIEYLSRLTSTYDKDIPLPIWTWQWLNLVKNYEIAYATSPC